MELRNSRIKANLLKALAGERQAYNWYSFVASPCKAQKLTAVRQIFLSTAEQEREHTKIFEDFIKTSARENIKIMPPSRRQNNQAKKLLRALLQQILEYQKVNMAFAETAEQEGYTKISAAFYTIAAIEKMQGDKFLRIADHIANNRLFHTGTICD